MVNGFLQKANAMAWHAPKAGIRITTRPL